MSAETSFRNQEKVLSQQETRKRAVRDCRPLPGLVLCGVCVLLYCVIKKRHNENCHFITADSDDWVPRHPTLMQPRFDRHLTLTHDVFFYYSIEFRMGLKLIQFISNERPNRYSPVLESSEGAQISNEQR